MQYSLFTSAERIASAWLKAQELHNIFVRLNKVLSSGPHMSHPLLFSHLPCTTSTSSSSFTLPSTTTPEHAAQSGQLDLLQAATPTGYEPKELATVSSISGIIVPYQLYDVHEKFGEQYHRAPITVK